MDIERDWACDVAGELRRESRWVPVRTPSNDSRTISHALKVIKYSVNKIKVGQRSD